MLDALGEIQLELRQLGLDAWLLYDRGRANPVACQLLGLDEGRSTRPIAYLVHAEELPHLVVHACDARRFGDLPGDRTIYTSRTQLLEALERLLRPRARVAIEHCPMGSLTGASWIDGGSLELLQSYGAKLVSSAPLVARFVATWGERELATHREAAARAGQAFERAWQRLVAEPAGADEARLAAWLLEEVQRLELVLEDGPVVAAGPHSADPEHRPGEPRSVALAPGTPVVVGLRVRCRSPVSAAWTSRYWTAFMGREPPARFAELFAGASLACDVAIDVLAERLEREATILGCEVDAAVRRELHARGLGELLSHRTGHSLGTRRCDGLGVHLDDLETRDTRPVLPGTALAITPGLYERDFGARVGANVVVDELGRLTITAPRQAELVVLP